MILQVTLGAAAGAVYVALAGRITPRPRWYATGLVIAALIYLGFALAGPDGWTLLELAGVALFGLLAWSGLRLSSWYLALGWLLHTGWDGWLHNGPVPGFVPHWYPGLCIGFDVLVAGAIAAPLIARRDATAH